MIANNEKLHIFNGLTEQEIERVSQASPTRTFQKNEYIIQAGESGNHLYIILQGRVKVVIPTRDGRANKLLTFMEYGDCFGEIAMMLHVKRSADVIATQETKVLLLSESKAMEFMSTHKNMMFNMLKYSLNRIYQLSLDSEVSTLKSSDKVFYFLKWRIAHEDNAGNFYIPQQEMPSVQEIADYIGLHRSTVHDNIKALNAKGKLVHEKDMYFLADG